MTAATNQELKTWAYSVMPRPRPANINFPFTDTGDEWCYQHKMDGDRCLLFVYSNLVVGLSKVGEPFFSSQDDAIQFHDYLPEPHGKVTVFDSELCNGNVYIFDTLVWEGEALRDLPFKTRYKLAYGLTCTTGIGVLEVVRLPVYTGQGGYSRLWHVEASDDYEGEIARRASGTLQTRPTLFKHRYPKVHQVPQGEVE